MIDLSRMFDSYNRQARLYPALIVLLPVLLTVLARHPDLLTSNAGTTFVALVSSCGFLYAIGTVARSRGKDVEKRLLGKWGGWPTTLWLRHGDSSLSAQTKARYHAALVKRVPGLRLPSAAEEAADSARADDAYGSAVEWLKEQSRGKPLVEKENAEYGFRRNTRGLRAFGAAAAVFGLALAGLWIWRVAGLTIADLNARNVMVIGDKIAQPPLRLLWAAAAIDVMAIGFWVVVVRDGWVRQAGDQYARALLSNCDVLP